MKTTTSIRILTKTLDQVRSMAARERRSVSAQFEVFAEQFFASKATARKRAKSKVA